MMATISYHKGGKHFSIMVAVEDVKRVIDELSGDDIDNRPVINTTLYRRYYTGDEIPGSRNYG